MRLARTCIGRIALAAGMCACAGCGYDSGNDGSPDIATTPTITALAAQGEFTDFPAVREGKVVAGAALTVAFTSTSPNGSNPGVRAQVDWTLPEDTLEVGFYADGCFAEKLAAGGCSLIVMGDRQGTRAESVANMGRKPGNYVLGIRNLGPHAESGAYQVVLSYDRPAS